MKLTWLDHTRPRSEIFDDIYYTEEDGLAETRYVFIGQNDLECRFEKAQSVLTIGELGFGTGLNFLATWHQWRVTRKNPLARLHYISCEKFPLSQEQLARALSRWPELESLSEMLLMKYIELPNGFYRFCFDEDRVTLTLLIGDAAKTLPELSAQIDAWYFDGFSPQKNPDLWSSEIFSQVARLSKREATFATYASAGFVRRNIQEAGFIVEKMAGFGRKREMLKGTYCGASSVANEDIQSDIAPPAPHFRNSRIAILGAGLSGCSMANALSKRGYNITLIDRGPTLASEASGNIAGISLPALSAEPSLLGELGFSGLVYLRSSSLDLGHFQTNGLLQFAPDDLKISKWKRGLEHSSTPPSFARMIDAAEANERAGIALNKPALLYENAGALSIPSLSKNLVKDLANLPKVLLNNQILQIRRESNVWILTDQSGGSLEVDIVILCSAYDTLNLELSKHLPLRKVRGQVIEIECQELDALKTPLCFEEYLTPRLPHGRHLLGASFDRESLTSEVRNHESEKLLEGLTHFLSPLSINAKVNSARVSFRTSAPGQEPLAGELVDTHGHKIENAFVLTALASRGSLYAGILAEMIASKINGEPSPLPIAVLQGLSPKRFFN